MPISEIVMNSPAVQAPVSTVAPPSLRGLVPLTLWKIALVTITFTAALISLECVWLRGRQEARSIAWANERVVEKIATAQAQMAEQCWDKAIRHLEDALAEEQATNREEVAPVLTAAQRGQAEAMLDAARIALSRKETADTLRLLRAYLAHPQAAHLDRARLLCDDLEHALSDDEAARLLARLSDEALSLFANEGQLTEDDGLHSAATHALFQETLRRNVANEICKREARREVARLAEKRRAAERVRRIARLRDTPAFHSLSDFLARTLAESRHQQQLAQRQQTELGELFRQLGVNDAAEQDKIRADLLDRESSADVREAVERKRAEIKQVYRKSAEFHSSDQGLFDQLTDQEVDNLLRMLPNQTEPRP